MNEANPRFQRVQEFWQGLTEREQRLLSILGVVISVVVVFLGLNSVRVNLKEYTVGVDRGHEALEMLGQRREAYLRARAKSKAFDEKLSENTVQLAAFTERMASQAGIGAPRNFRDQETPIPNSSGITKQSTTVTFPEVSIVQLNELLQAIERSEQLVYIEGIELEPQRRGSRYELQLTISTYRTSRGGS